MKSLQNHCMELQFHRPTKQQIRGRLLQIAQQEGLKARAPPARGACRFHARHLTFHPAQVNDIAMEALIESCNSDIRLVLNTLQARRACRLHATLFRERDSPAYASHTADAPPELGLAAV